MKTSASAGWRGLFAAIALVVAGCEADAPPVARVPAHTAVELHREAIGALTAKDYTVALGRADEAIQEDPEYPLVYYTKACALTELGRADEALKTLDDVLNLKRDYAEAYLFRGILLEKAGDQSAARKAYAQAIANAMPDDPASALTGAAAAYLRDGKLRGGRAIEEVLAAHPSYVPAQRIKQCIVDDNRAFFMDWIPGRENTAETAGP